jgi:hypothetical protein
MSLEGDCLARPFVGQHAAVRVRYPTRVARGLLKRWQPTLTSAVTTATSALIQAVSLCRSHCSRPGRTTPMGPVSATDPSSASTRCQPCAASPLPVTTKQVSFGLALRQRSNFRVFFLHEPNRTVIDVKH